MLLAWRNLRATLTRLIAPFIFLLLVLLIDGATRASNAGDSQYAASLASAVRHRRGSLDCDWLLTVKLKSIVLQTAPPGTHTMKTHHNCRRSANMGSIA